LDEWDPGMNVSGKVRNVIRTTAASRMAQTVRRKDKADRATVELVLDPRTMTILRKMTNNGVFAKMYGCVSTGKEANVYSAEAPLEEWNEERAKSRGSAAAVRGERSPGVSRTDVAIKIYKTSILVFKDRDRYVTGDYRFRNGYSKNPRKMVAMWAEKECRNLNRLRAAGIRCPKPLDLKLHVLVMEFVGEGSTAAPRLRDAQLTREQMREAYLDMVLIIRTMYQTCRLVHGDLSEYNLLWHRGEIWVIDVSQAVDLDHPHALTFLREDCSHVNAFFKRAGVATLNTRELFEFAVDPTINEENLEETINALMSISSARPVDISAAQEVDDAVFHQAWIPRRLDEIAKYERDIDRGKRGEKQEIYYQTITGMRDDLQGAQVR
jgi:RIO kinase 1